MQLRDLAVVALEEGDQVARQVVLVLVGEAADDAAVDGDVLRAPGRAGADEDVAGVHVGMEEAVAKHLGEENFHATFGQQFHVGALVGQGRQVSHRDAVDALHHQHLMAAQVPVHLRHVEQWRAVEVAPQLAGVGRLTQQVEFVVDGFLVVADHLNRAQATGIGGSLFSDAGDQEQPGQILTDDWLEARAHHLDHHLFAGLELRGMHLCHRSRGQRLAVETGEQLAHRGAQLALDQGDGLVFREGRHLILQARQLVGDIRR